jgi:hypothetical protein
MPLIARKFADLDTINVFLRGGIIGGKDFRPTATTQNSPVYGIAGKTLIFTTPSATVTFTTPGSAQQEGLDLKAILAQITAALGGNYIARAFQGRIAIIDKTAAVIVSLNSTGTANAMLGFDSSPATVGKIYAAPGNAAPALVSIASESLSGNSYVVTTDE